MWPYQRIAGTMGTMSHCHLAGKVAKGQSGLRCARPPRAIVLALAVLGQVAVAHPAAAQGGANVGDETRLVARDLATQGAEAFQAGRYEQALGLFQRAQKLVNAPTISIYAARSLQRLNRWVKAAEEFRRCAAHPLDSASPPLFVEAVRNAQGELDALLPLMPRLLVVTEPGANSDSSIRILMDGAPVDPAMIGVEFPLDPGRHELTATNASGAQGSALVDSVAGRSTKVTLVLVPTSRKTAPPGTTPVELSAPPAQDPRPGGTQRLLSYVALGVGGAGLAVGAVTGVIATSRHSKAERECPGFKCFDGTQGADAVRGFRTLSTVSTVSYAAGAVGVVAGAVLLLTAPSSNPRRGHVSPYLGLSSAGVMGSF